MIGNNYYVSFGNNEVKRCKLIAIDENRDLNLITIEIPTKPESKNGFIDQNGTISHNWVKTHELFADELGLTPEEAVINQVKS
jgi:hypothetical protein